MLGAVRLTGERVGTAEVKVLVIGVTVGPQAARPMSIEIEEITLRRSWRRADARRQRDPMQLANYRVLGQPQSAADLGGWQSLLKKLSQTLDALWRPGNDIHVIPPVYSGPPSPRYNIQYQLCGRVPSNI